MNKWASVAIILAAACSRATPSDRSAPKPQPPPATTIVEPAKPPVPVQVKEPAPTNLRISYLGPITGTREDRLSVTVSAEAVFVAALGDSDNPDKPHVTRIAIATESGLDWKRYDKGIETTIESRNIGGSDMASVVDGSTTSNLWFRFSQPTRTGSNVVYFRFDKNRGWQKATDRGAPGGDVSMSPEEWIATQAIDVGGDNFMRLPNGEIWVAGCVQKKPSREPDDSDAKDPPCHAQLHRWKPGGKLRVTKIPTTADGDAKLVASDRSTGAFFYVDDELKHFDGTTWTSVDWPDSAGEIHFAKDGSLWSVDGSSEKTSIQRREPDGKIQTLPAPESIQYAAGIEQGFPWILSKKGTLYSWDEPSMKWLRVALPQPSFASPHATEPPALPVYNEFAPPSGIAPLTVTATGDVWALVSLADAASDNSAEPIESSALLHIVRNSQP